MSSKLECPNCGYDLNSSEKVCKYCGSLNSNFVPVPSKPSFNLNNYINSNNNSNSSSSNSTTTSSKSNFSCLLFGILLIFFWPAAIVYAVLVGLKK